MDILILGGTRFLGRHIVDAALAAGHTVADTLRWTNSVPDLSPPWRPSGKLLACRPPTHPIHPNCPPMTAG